MITQIKPRQYTTALCYVCQLCLLCKTDNTFETCACEKGKRPTKNETKVTNYGRIITTKQNHAQIQFLKEKSELFGYNSNFREKFNASFCSKCHSQFVRIAKVPFSNSHENNGASSTTPLHS